MFISVIFYCCPGVLCFFSDINLFNAVEQNMRLDRVATAQEMVREISSLKLGKSHRKVAF